MGVELSPNRPLVSIVTPSFNSRPFIAETVESVACQTYPRVEHIIVDGGSTDGTVKLLKANADRIRWVSEPDQGQSDAVNKGWQMAHGDILGWLNADDVYLEDAVEMAVNALSSYGCGMVFGDVYRMDSHGTIYARKHNPNFSVERLREYPWWVTSAAMFVRRDPLFRAGLLDIRLHYAMDYDLFLRLSRHTDVLYLPKVLAAFRVHRRSKSQSQARAHLHEIRSLYVQHGGSYLPSRFWLHYVKLALWSRIPGALRRRLRPIIFTVGFGEPRVSTRGAAEGGSHLDSDQR